MALNPALGRQRQADLNEFVTSLVYKGSPRTAKVVTWRNPVSKNKQTQLEWFLKSPEVTVT